MLQIETKRSKSIKYFLVDQKPENQVCLQARSQDLEKGGSFERVRKVQRTLTRIFIILESVSHGLSEIWDGISRKALKFKCFFRSKTGGLQKKKGLHRNWVWFFGQNRKFKRFFRSKTSGLQKKKRSSPKLSLIFRPKSNIQTIFQPKNKWSPKKKTNMSLIFRPKSKIQTLFHTESRHLLHNFGTQFPLGGAVFNFSPKIDLKSNKNVRFCILHKPMGGGLEPPRPPSWLRYCVLVNVSEYLLNFSQKS